MRQEILAGLLGLAFVSTTAAAQNAALIERGRQIASGVGACGN